MVGLKRIASGDNLSCKTGAPYHQPAVEKMCVNPSKLLGINKGTLETGRSADITIVDLNEEFVVDVNKFKSKSKNSPFHGFKLNGSVYYTLVNGNVVVREKVLL